MSGSGIVALFNNSNLQVALESLIAAPKLPLASGNLRPEHL